MLQRILRIGAWIAGGIVALIVVAYLVLVAINWRDAQPSAAAVRLTDVYRSRPALADEDNAFVYVTGFEVPAGEDPRGMGVRRIAWMRKSIQAGSWDHSADSLEGSRYKRDGRSAAIKQFIDSCMPGKVDCTAAFLAGEPVFEEWMAAERWVFERYRRLIAHPGWLESVPFDSEAPIPPYALVVDGQRLLLLQARALAQKGDYAGVRELLEGDLRFWRMVLASSDLMITKMIATGAMRRHFELGNLVLREIKPGAALSAVPAGWSAAISDLERSMLRCMTGEWIWVSGVMAKRSPSSDEAEQTLLARSADVLFKPLFQPQDSVNLYAEHYLRIAESLSVPFDGYDDAVNQLARDSERLAATAFPPRSAYNIVGRTLQAGGPDFSSYASRVGDIEGVRRAALLAVTLREAKVGVQDITTALQAAELRNPYDGQPFAWDERYGALLFRGLESGERGEHRIYY